MRQCRHCTKEFEPEAFEVFCSPECTHQGNANRNVQHTLGPPPIPAPMAEGMSEDEFQNSFVELFKSLKWKGYHTRTSRGSKEGYPDWTLWRERVIFVELKKETGELSAAQRTTIEELEEAGAEVHVWRPSDWKELVEVLTSWNGPNR